VAKSGTRASRAGQGVRPTNAVSGLAAGYQAAPGRLATDLESLEQRLTVLEEKMIAHARDGQSEEQDLASRQELDRQLRPYRSKMTAPQLALLEKQYLERNLLEQAGLPRLSLFYMR